MNRRAAIQQIGMTVLATGALPGAANLLAQAITPPPQQLFALQALPYAYDALEPYFDAETMHLHHQKHHQTYVNNLNALIATEPKLAGKSVEALLSDLNAIPESIRSGIRNQGGGHANHSFWWQTLGKPGSEPKGELAKAIDQRFGSFAGFQQKLTAAAVRQFGSGWAWLVKLPDGALSLENTDNQDSPLSVGHQPLLGIDVWEHAYYLKYQNRRADYVKAYFQVVNWEWLSANFAAKG